jgi:DICT domain-containing protein
MARRPFLSGLLRELEETIRYSDMLLALRKYYQSQQKEETGED